MPVFDPVVADYRYFVADLVTNVVLAELPFKSVSYERAIKSAGSFSGNVPILSNTEAFSLYENTMPGRTALYVVRNDQCVWGGIIWNRSYSVVQRELSVTAAEFTSYFHHRNIWKTYSHEYPATIVASSGTAAVTLTNGEFSFVADMPVKISFYEVADFQYNGTKTILSSPTPTDTTFSCTITGLPNGTYTNVTVTVRVDTYDYVRQLIDTILNDFTNIEFPNDEIEPSIQTAYVVTDKVLTSNVATLTTSSNHNIIVGQVVDVQNIDATFNGTYEVQSVTGNTVSYNKTAGNVGSTAVSVNSKSVTFKELNAVTSTATLTTSASHGFSVGDVVEVIGVDDPSTITEVFGGERKVLSVPSSTTFTYLAVNGTNILSTAVVGTAVATPRVLSNSYGPFAGNSDIGITYSTASYSGVSVENTMYRGFELRSVGEELDRYSDTIDGFEYRVDCSYDTATSSFTRVFTLIPINFPNPPPAGQASPITRFGAQNLVFEYPGNISDVKIDESAEDAATRFFVVGNDSELGQDASQPYAAASATDLIADGWPILDGETTKSDTIDEATLYSYAQRYLGEFRPPVSDFSVTVNGSLNPTVGSYYPGDWCCLIIDDYFVQQRLASALEPRSDLLVRKIESFKVSVPDNPSFPEQVTLNLVTEWEVDKLGE